MLATPRVTLDDPALRRRLHRNFSEPKTRLVPYSRRRVIRQKRLINDVLEKRHRDRRQYNRINYSGELSPGRITYHAISTPQIIDPPKAIPTKVEKLTKKKKLSKLAEIQALFRVKKLQIAIVGIAICMVIVGAYFSLVGLRATHVEQIQAEKLTQEANNQNGTSNNPSTVKPSSSTVSNYVVAPDLPRYLNIPKLGVHAIVLQVGKTSSGALATPPNVFETAWYTGSAKPGQPGAVLIDGHVSSWTAHGVFYGLHTLVAGDIIQIERGDGTMFTYKVVKKQVYPANKVDMQAAITPVIAGKPGLNLITCTGHVIPGTSLFNERVIVFAEQV